MTITNVRKGTYQGNWSLCVYKCDKTQICVCICRCICAAAAHVCFAIWQHIRPKHQHASSFEHSQWCCWWWGHGKVDADGYDKHVKHIWTLWWSWRVKSLTEAQAPTRVIIWALTTMLLVMRARESWCWWLRQTCRTYLNFLMILSGKKFDRGPSTNTRHHLSTQSDVVGDECTAK